MMLIKKKLLTIAEEEVPLYPSPSQIMVALEY
jgi:hypothetical protein